LRQVDHWSCVGIVRGTAWCCGVRKVPIVTRLDRVSGRDEEARNSDLRHGAPTEEFEEQNTAKPGELCRFAT
jgi:hypothetical protein